MFSLCGKLIGHLPVCSWLRVVAGIIKQRAGATSERWDVWTYDASLRRMLTETINKVNQADLCKGKCCVNSEELNIWVDVSFWPWAF